MGLDEMRLYNLPQQFLLELIESRGLQCVGFNGWLQMKAFRSMGLRCNQAALGSVTCYKCEVSDICSEQWSCRRLPESSLNSMVWPWCEFSGVAGDGCGGRRPSHTARRHRASPQCEFSRASSGLLSEQRLSRTCRMCTASPRCEF